LLHIDAILPVTAQILRTINNIAQSNTTETGHILYTTREREMSGSKPEVDQHPLLYISTEHEMQSLRPVAIDGGVRYTSTEAEMTALKLEMIHLKDDMRQIEAFERDAPRAPAVCTDSRLHLQARKRAQEESQSAISRSQRELEEASQRPGVSGCGYGGEAMLTVRVHQAKELRSRMFLCRSTYVALRVGETSMQTKVLPPNISTTHVSEPIWPCLTGCSG